MKVGINVNIENIRKEGREEDIPEEDQEEGRLNGGKGGPTIRSKLGLSQCQSQWTRGS